MARDPGGESVRELLGQVARTVTLGDDEAVARHAAAAAGCRRVAAAWLAVIAPLEH